MKFVYSPDYYADIGNHVFPVEKYRLIYESLCKIFPEIGDSILTPYPAADWEVLLVHAGTYVRKLKKGTLSASEIMKLEVPYSSALVDLAWLFAGGTIQACRSGLSEKCGIHIGGGFHHAFNDHGEGFCVLNDIAIGICALMEEGSISRTLIVDCDVHQGNGTASIFSEDPSVFTFSIHQRNNYPLIKPPSDLDIDLDDGTGDREYLDHIVKKLPRIIEKHTPDLIVYVAGADPYKNDQLGGLNLSINGLRERDRIVFGLAKKYRVAVAAVLGGGYAYDVYDTVRIHVNTLREALSFFKE